MSSLVKLALIADLSWLRSLKLVFRHKHTTTGSSSTQQSLQRYCAHLQYRCTTAISQPEIQFHLSVCSDEIHQSHFYCFTICSTLQLSLVQLSTTVIETFVSDQTNSPIRLYSRNVYNLIVLLLEERRNPLNFSLLGLSMNIINEYLNIFLREL